MKELSIEEKAKLYDEAIEQIKECNPDENGFITIYPQEIFPELKESEDERIREKIIDFLRLPHPQFVGKRDHEEWISWLEKQSEQKANVVVRRFLIGDTFIDKYYPTNVFTVTEYIENGIAYVDQSGERFTKYYDDSWDDYQLIEQKPKEHAKGEDYGIDGLYNAIRILEKTLGKVDGYQTDDGILEHECAITAVKRLYEQKPWSEEDERNLNDTILFIETGTYSLDKDNLINWLKSLKPQNTWKPSDEQMEALEHFIVYHNGSTNYAKDLEELRLQLKKLKE